MATDLIATDLSLVTLSSNVLSSSGNALSSMGPSIAGALKEKSAVQCGTKPKVDCG